MIIITTLVLEPNVLIIITIVTSVSKPDVFTINYHYYYNIGIGTKCIEYDYYYNIGIETRRIE